MENSKNTKIQEICVFFLMAVLAGIMIGIGGCASLLANNLLGTFGRAIGAVLFSLGIYTVVAYEMRLFTGMVAYIPTMGVKNLWRLVLCFLGNALGVYIIAILAKNTSIGQSIYEQANTLIENKLLQDNWAIKALCSSILCGMLITVSVRSVSHAPKKTLSTTVGVMLPVIVFVYCGFDHSVANMLYFYYYGKFTLQIIGYILLTIVGNIIGGVILPFISLLKEKTEAKEDNDEICNNK